MGGGGNGAQSVISATPMLDLRFSIRDLQNSHNRVKFTAEFAPSFYAYGICIKGFCPRGRLSFYAYSICIKGRGGFC